jgi:hypothetical protein
VDIGKASASIMDKFRKMAESNPGKLSSLGGSTLATLVSSPEMSGLMKDSKMANDPKF